MSENPYTATASDPLMVNFDDKKTDSSLLSIARVVFLAWEKLRVVYVMVLALITLAMTGTSLFSNFGLLLLIVVGAVISNIAFFAGPIVETYIRWLGYKKIWPRWLMFGSGTLLSAVLAFGTLASELLPNQN